VTTRTVLVCPSSVKSSSPVCTSHTGGFSVRSDPAASLPPSGLKATVVSFGSWPVSVTTSSPVSASHMVTPAGSAGAAKVAPSGAKATQA
jgi:hypothetical protein